MHWDIISTLPWPKNNGIIFQKQLIFIFASCIILKVTSGCGEVWYRAWFGTKRPWVQVPSLRPFSEKHSPQSECFFLWPNWFRTDVRDQVLEPTAAGGGWRKAEKKKNKEYHEAPQASETTIFFLVAMGSRSRLPPRSVLLCCAQRCPPDTRTQSLRPILIKVDSKRINLNFFVLFHLLLVFLFVHCAVKIGLCTKIVSGI